MGTIKAWQSVVQQLKNLKKLAARREQHVAQGKTRAAAADADTLDEVTEQMRANLKSCRGLEVDNAEWEKLVLELKVSSCGICGRCEQAQTLHAQQCNSPRGAMTTPRLTKHACTNVLLLCFAGA
jgi:hypothetical protein